jgi:ABC-type polysaccharide/polyol phosphate transport system ATPase subunit/SAM-dependent methyltransferase
MGETMIAPPALRVRDLVKEFEVYAKPRDLAIELLARRKRHRLFRALGKVSFDVAKGEVLGIIGANGAGKSTLLKIITGVLDPTAGSVEIRGRVTAILELGLGFNPEYSGRENIRLSGLLYGLGHDEIEQKLESIVEFSGLAEFIDLPVKTYSSGMHSRLAFSIATAADPEILIIDEALAAGDAMFTQKCLRRIRELCGGGRTVLLVSHGTGLLAQLCQRVMWLDRGRIKSIGPALSVIQAYDLAAHASADARSWIEEVVEAPHPLHSVGGAMKAASDRVPPPPAVSRGGSVAAVRSSAVPALDAAIDATTELAPPWLNLGQRKQVLRRGPILIDSVELLDTSGEPTQRLVALEPFRLRVRYHCEGELPKDTLGIALAVNRAHDLAPVSQWFTQNIMSTETRQTYHLSPLRQLPAENGVIELSFPYTPYAGGEYVLSIGLLANQPANWEFYEYRHLFYRFTVDDRSMMIGAPVFFQPEMKHIASGRYGDRPEPLAYMLPEPRTLREEVDRLSRDERPYARWPCHERCPACAQGPLRPVFEKDGFRHVQCLVCELVCLDPYPPTDVVGKLYSGNYYTNVRELFEYPRLRDSGKPTPFSASHDVLSKVIDKVTAGKAVGRWLEVGGGLGAFAALIKKSRPGWNVLLNEFNARSLEIAKSLYDLEVSDNDPMRLLEKGETFDVISSVAVLEHSTHPFEFIESYARLLAPGGTLVTIVPNFTPLNAAVSKGSSPNVAPPFHASLFGRKSFQRLFARSGLFRSVEVTEDGPPAFSLMHHVDYSSHWDVSIPTSEDPEPRSLQVVEYDHETALRINVLFEANEKLGDFFAETDGRLLLVAYAVKGDG